MRCFFNFSTQHDSLIDEEGVEVSSLDHVHSEALQAIQEISQDAGAPEVDWSDWTLSVTDPSGQVLLTLALETIVSKEAPPLQ
ncbi:MULTISPECIES: DUF6894 family protein [Microvirga]|uniref:DUF6894 family protein n=1 Tax=Microvirga TaxID=186650 RepID=UPI00360D476E